MFGSCGWSAKESLLNGRVALVATAVVATCHLALLGVGGRGSSSSSGYAVDDGCDRAS